MKIELVVTYVVTLAIGVFIPLIIQFIQIKNEKKAKLKAIRINEYKTYLEALENISKYSMIETEIFINESLQKFFSEVNKGGGLEDAAAILQGELVGMSMEVGGMVNKLKNEMMGIKLVSSEKLYMMIEEYQSCLVENSDFLIKYIKNVNLLESSVNDIVESATGQSDYSDLEKKLDLIIKQMRSELEIQ